MPMKAYMPDLSNRIRERESRRGRELSLGQCPRGGLWSPYSPERKKETEGGERANE